MLWYTCLSLAEDNVTFPRMNYRRKKISMKERLEEAIEEIGGEPPQGLGVEREAPDELLPNHVDGLERPSVTKKGAGPVISQSQAHEERPDPGRPDA